MVPSQACHLLPTHPSLPPPHTCRESPITICRILDWEYTQRDIAGNNTEIYFVI